MYATRRHVSNNKTDDGTDGQRTGDDDGTHEWTDDATDGQRTDGDDGTDNEAGQDGWRRRDGRAEDDGDWTDTTGRTRLDGATIYVVPKFRIRH